MKKFYLPKHEHIEHILHIEFCIIHKKQNPIKYK